MERFSSTLRYIFLGILTVVLAVILLPMALGSRFNLGGFLGGLWGYKRNQESGVILAERNSIPKSRSVAPGQPDSTGQIQLEHKPIKRRINPWRDKSIIALDDGKVKRLPDGVIDSDVESEVVVQGEVTVVQVKTGVDANLKSARQIHDLMNKIEERNREGLS